MDVGEEGGGTPGDRDEMAMMAALTRSTAAQVRQMLPEACEDAVISATSVVHATAGSSPGFLLSGVTYVVQGSRVVGISSALASVRV